MPYSEDCCGFGGTFATKFAMISARWVQAGNGKIRLEYITSTDPSCLLHLDGILRKKNSKVRTIYLGSILAQTSAAAGATARDAKKALTQTEQYIESIFQVLPEHGL